MPQNKRHHFVPKFYLRNFSGDGNSIGIFNIALRRTIPRGNLGNQCYRDYFYGKDPTLEHALAGIEGTASLVIKGMLETGNVPLPLSAEHLVLSHFIVLQASRTGYEAEAQAEAVDKFYKMVYREQFGNLDNYQIGFDDPILLSLRAAARVVPAVYDLKLKLFRNDTDVGFITSDNPVVRHNQLFEGNDHAGHCGWAQAGLQVFLPLSAKYLCALYDRQTYKAGDKSARMVSITARDDVMGLNALQWLNAHENVYFADGEAASVQEQAPRVIPRRRAEKTSVFEHAIVTPKEERDPDRERTLLQEFRPALNVRLKVSFLKPRRHPKHPRHDFRSAPPRDAEYLAVVEEFDRLVIAKQARPEGFLAYAASCSNGRQR